MRIIIVVLFLICFTAVLSIAQEVRHENFDENATQLEINATVAKNYEIAECSLDSVYSAILKDMSYEHYYGSSDTSEPDLDVRKALIQSQKQWVKFRDAETELVKSFFKGGSMAGATAWQYRTQLALDRIRELKLLQEIRYGRAVPKPNWEVK